MKKVNLDCQKIWKFINYCITGYLIKKSYNKTKKNRLSNYNENQDSNNFIIHKEDYVVLRLLGFGSVFRTSLIYHLERCELMALKEPNIDDKEIPRLIERERVNYSKIRHPLLPKSYETEDINGIIIEFINGQTLDKIDKMNLNASEVITIIFELIIIIDYIHSKDLIYRDLKPT